MKPSLKESILEGLEKQTGQVGFYYKNLITGETLAYREQDSFLAASVIKLPIFMCISKWCAEGKASMEERIRVKNEDKLPICGALTLFTDEPLVDIRTLCNLMISLSDNTATNLLIRRFGIEAYQKEFLQIGLKHTVLNRLLFDPEASARGLQNRIVPAEMGMLLEKIYRRAFVDPQVSEDIEKVLLLQQINHKIPGKIGEGVVPIAHKTGEDDNLTNDVGLIYTKEPFILAFAGYDTCVGDFEDLMREVSYQLFRENNGNSAAV